MRTRIVSGTVRLAAAPDGSGPDGASLDGGCVMRVFVEDTSRMDAPAQRVAALEVALAQLPAAGEAVPFQLTVPEAELPARLNLRVHLDRSADGEIDEGDFITMQSYPIDEGDTGPMEIEARQA